jgi:hypothetical protein
LIACHLKEFIMDFDLSAFDYLYHSGESATNPLIRLDMRLPLYSQGVGRIRKAAKAATTPLSRVVAGTSQLSPCFASAARPIAPSGASNYGFQV